MSDYQNFAIQVTRTSVVTINVFSRDLESATRQATSMALERGFAHTDMSADAIAIWPASEPEDDFYIPTDDGFEIRRGWFWEGNLDFHSISLTSAQVWTACPEVDARKLGTMIPAFEPHLTGNQTLFGITKRYGFATRQPGDKVWSTVVPTQDKAVREAKAERNTRRREQEREAYLKLRRDTIANMVEDKDHALLRVKGGRWTVAKVLGDRDPLKTALADGEWFATSALVNELLEDGKVKVCSPYTSDRHNRVVLTDAVLRPF